MTDQARGDDMIEQSKDGGPAFDGETILPDDYPVYGDYLYIADGRVYRSDWHDITVRELKAREKFSEIRRCNIVARRDAMLAQRAGMT